MPAHHVSCFHIVHGSRDTSKTNDEDMSSTPSHTTPMDSILGAIIERRYLLREPVGEGGFAEVFEASDTKLGRRVALKILKHHPDPSQRQLAGRRFFREAKLAAQLTHPHVITIFDYGQTEDARPYIVMEYLEGKPLSRHLWQHGPMHPERAYKLFLQMTHAIATAHHKGVIHRDLKPSNIVIVHEDTHLESVKVLDFGIAFFFEDALTRLTSTGQFLGTPEYLAPEYIGEREITPALDVYQLALILIEMLIGRPLVAFDEPIQCMFAHYNGHVKVPKYLQDAPIGAILTRALTRQPAQRFHNAQTFFDALNELDPSTIPALPSHTTPEELAITRDWESKEVDAFSKVFEERFSRSMHELDPLASTTSFDPHQRSEPFARAGAGTHPIGPSPSVGERMSGKNLRLLGGLILVAILTLSVIAFGIDARRTENPSARTPPPGEAVAEPAVHAPGNQVYLTVSPPTAIIREDDTVLGKGSAMLLIASDATSPRRITVEHEGYTSHTRELSMRSPREMRITLDALPKPQEDPTPLKDATSTSDPVATKPSSPPLPSTTKPERPATKKPIASSTKTEGGKAEEQKQDETKASGGDPAGTSSPTPHTGDTEEPTPGTNFKLFK